MKLGVVGVVAWGGGCGGGVGGGFRGWVVMVAGVLGERWHGCRMEELLTGAPLQGL